MRSQLIVSLVFSIVFELYNSSLSVEGCLERDINNQTTNNTLLPLHQLHNGLVSTLPPVLWCAFLLTLLIVLLLILVGLVIRQILNVIYKPSDIDINYYEQQPCSYCLIDHSKSDLFQIESSSSERQQCDKWALPRSGNRSTSMVDDRRAEWPRQSQSIVNCDLCLTDNLYHLIHSHVELLKYNIQHHHFAYLKKKMVLIEYVGCANRKFHRTHKNLLSLAEIKEIQHNNLTKFVGFLLIDEDDIKKISKKNHYQSSGSESIDLKNLTHMDQTRSNISRKMSNISRERDNSTDKNAYFKRRSLLNTATNWPRCFMIWQYKQSWKSLSEAIHQSDSKLNWPIKLSLINDIIQGMNYLHERKIVYCHGSLNSRNCLIDQWWQLKITKYGSNTCLSNGEQVEEPTMVMAEKSRLEKLWLAPEQLRNTKHLDQQASDVYSFALLLYELLTERLPYDNYLQNYTIDQVLAFIANPHKFEEHLQETSLKHDNQSLLIRPKLPESMVFTSEQQNLVKLITWCWNEKPQGRPSFNTIKQYFQNSIDKYSGLNLIERMAKRLDKHQDEVEQQVRKRTAQLEKEKQASEELLYRVLPIPVAKSLQTGTFVKPEKFENVTIFFSDIVGFTTIASYSEPFEIIAVLNKLFTTFDDILSNYDVYKVETIGDAYMIVSGLPIRNNNHAEQIALVALDMINFCSQFKIEHMPSVPLRIRIGIHTGSVASGVVGTTNPRYCLFGDSVNIAARLESTGLPNTIHVSQATEKWLRTSPDFILKYRGEINLRGRGQCPTYWLLGKKNLYDLLPVPSPTGVSMAIDSTFGY